MKSQWTTREKKMILYIMMLVVVMVSILFSAWVSKQEAIESGFELQSSTEKTGQEELIANKDDDSQLSSTVPDKHANKEKALKIIVVDVKGAVKHPNVYTMKEGQRVVDAIREAGDVVETGTLDYINLAQKLEDGMLIYIPTEDEVDDEQNVTSFVSTPNVSASSSSSGKININSASAAELERLPGVGPSRAEAIVNYREENGDFTSIDEIMNISGIGPKTYDNLKELIEK
jgi:competence protein ComEA